MLCMNLHTTLCCNIMKRKLITIEVTNQGAVYANGTRITGRDTKWGIHTTVFEAKVAPGQVSKVLADNNYGHIRLDKEYALELGIQ